MVQVSNLLQSMMTLLLAASLHQAAALLVAPVHTTNTFDPANNWIGETTLHEMFGKDVIDELLDSGLMKTRQDPDHPEREQYFVVMTPADAAFIYSDCPQKYAEGHGKLQNQEVSKRQNLGKEWTNTEKVREEYGGDKVDKLVDGGRLEERQHPDFPERTQLGKEWISTQNLLEKYGFHKVEELFRSGYVEKRQNPSCPERTQYFVKEEPVSTAETNIEDAEEYFVKADVQDPREATLKRHDDAKVHKNKAKNDETTLHKHGHEETVAKHDEAKSHKQDKPKVQKHEHAKHHKDKLQQHENEEADAQTHTGRKGKDADLVVDSESEDKSAAVKLSQNPTICLATVVAIISSVFLA